jgi:hypothetical protein
MPKSQTIIRAKHDTNNPYFMMQRDTAQDERLSWESRGMLCYLLSKPDNWAIQVIDLTQQCGKGKVYRIITELKKSGYIENRIRQRNSRGKWEWTPYILHESPIMVNNDHNPKTRTRLPEHGEPDTEKREIIQSTDKQNKETKKPILSAKVSDPAKQKDSNSEVAITDKHPKLSGAEFQIFIDTLKSEFSLHGGTTLTIYNMLRGTIAKKKKHTAYYEYGKLFRDKPVTVAELKSFAAWYKIECPNCSLSKPATIENYFGKYRATLKKPKFDNRLQAMKLPANFEMLNTQCDGVGAQHATPHEKLKMHAPRDEGLEQ